MLPHGVSRVIFHESMGYPGLYFMKYLHLSMIVLFLLIVPIVCHADVIVPSVFDFEDTDTLPFYIGNLGGQNSWSVNGIGDVLVTNAFARNGSQSVSFNGAATAAIVFDSTDTLVLWIDGFVRTEGSTTTSPIETLPALSSILEFHASNGIRAFDGDGQGSGIMIDLGVPVDPGKWQRITIKQDYSSKKWDLYVDGMMIRAGLGFHSDSADCLTTFAQQNHTSAYLDFFSVTALGLEFDIDGDSLKDLDEYKFHKTNPFIADTDGDEVNDDVEIAAGTDPLDPNSYFKVTLIELSGDTVSITWPTVFGKSYMVQGTSNLTLEWSDISETITEADPMGGIAEFMHDFSAIGLPKYFYRIRIISND